MKQIVLNQNLNSELKNLKAAEKEPNAYNLAIFGLMGKNTYDACSAWES